MTRAEGEYIHGVFVTTFEDAEDENDAFTDVPKRGLEQGAFRQHNESSR